MSKNEYKIIKDFLDKEDSLFDTLTITIGNVPPAPSTEKV